ncbi:MAG TPA: hypothetical protein VIV11_32575, partial [Kofleriaceae bacterium]
IDVSIPRLGTKSITFRYRVYRAPRVIGPSSARLLCAEGQVVCAVVDLAKFVAVAIPEHVANMLRDLVES